MARELRSDRDGSRRGVTISGVIGEKRRREGVSGLQFRPRLGCLSRVHYCTDNQAVPGSRGREKGDGGSWGGLSECSRGGQACNLTVVGRPVGRGKTVH